ncbi:MAG: hypothetical protein KFW21_07055 [Spirochaetota bacterium]|nr:hypothetical protein [Spirochaetota bacterium]
MKSVQINKIVSKFNRVNRSNKIKIICDTKKIQKNYFIYELKLTYTNKIDTISTFYIEKKSGIIEQPLPSNEYEKLFVNLINNQDNNDTLDLPFSYDHIEIKQIQKIHDEKKFYIFSTHKETFDYVTLYYNLENKGYKALSIFIDKVGIVEFSKTYSNIEKKILQNTDIINKLKQYNEFIEKYTDEKKPYD